MLDLMKLIEVECKARNIDNYSVRPVQVEITSPYMILPLDKYIYLFASEAVDTPALPTMVDLQSPDNSYQFTKTTLSNTVVAQYQFFTEELIIKTSNYGSNNPKDFLPFMLEFLKVIPNTEEVRYE